MASADWFRRQTDRLAKTLPPEKTVIGMGTYGYDWQIGGSGSEEVTFGQVVIAAVTNHAPIEWDADTGNPVLRYQARGQRHEAWFLDAVTGLNEARQIAAGGFRGVGLWRLGAEDPDLWNVLKIEGWPVGDYDPHQLAQLTAQKSVLLTAAATCSASSQTPHDGSRKVVRDAAGNYSEQYGQLPSYFVIESSGGGTGKALCLTFDDGPDPRYTPGILDILKSHGVQASFFVIGANADQNIGLIKREYAEGHDIGNHTYTHPNIALVSPERAALELSTTQRIIENALGVSTRCSGRLTTPIASRRRRGDNAGAARAAGRLRDRRRAHRSARLVQGHDRG